MYMYRWKFATVNLPNSAEKLYGQCTPYWGDPTWCHQINVSNETRHFNVHFISRKHSQSPQSCWRQTNFTINVISEPEINWTCPKLSELSSKKTSKIRNWMEKAKEVVYIYLYIYVRLNEEYESEARLNMIYWNMNTI